MKPSKDKSLFVTSEIYVMHLFAFKAALALVDSHGNLMRVSCQI